MGDEEYEDMKAWVGADWSPEKFEKDKIEFCNPYKRWKKAFLDEARTAQAATVNVNTMNQTEDIDKL